MFLSLLLHYLIQLHACLFDYDTLLLPWYLMPHRMCSVGVHSQLWLCLLVADTPPLPTLHQMCSVVAVFSCTHARSTTIDSFCLLYCISCYAWCFLWLLVHQLCANLLNCHTLILLKVPHTQPYMLRYCLFSQLCTNLCENDTLPLLMVQCILLHRTCFVFCAYRCTFLFEYDILFLTTVLKASMGVFNVVCAFSMHEHTYASQTPVVVCASQCVLHLFVLGIGYV